MLRSLGQDTAAAGGALVGVVNGAGQAARDLAGGAETGTEVVGEGEQGAPVLGRVELVADEAVLAADTRRGRGEVDDLGVAALSVLVEGAAGVGAEQTLGWGTSATSTTMCRPYSRSVAAVRAPTPGNSWTGRGCRKAAIASGESSTTMHCPGGVRAQAIMRGQEVVEAPMLVRQRCYGRDRVQH